MLKKLNITLFPEKIINYACFHVSPIYDTFILYMYLYHLSLSFCHISLPYKISPTHCKIAQVSHSTIPDCFLK